jgi:hypothetical protein
MESFAKMVCRPQRSVICETSPALEAVFLESIAGIWIAALETAAQPCGALF